MTALDLYQVDAFTDKVFGGNPAAVCPLESWLPDDTLLNIASENNLSETAFFVRTAQGYHIRWFTPGDEVALCGHATLAAAFVIFRFMEPGLEEITFGSLSGKLSVRRTSEGLTLDFPVWNYAEAEVPAALAAALGRAPAALYKGPDWAALYTDSEAVRTLEPDMALLSGFDEARGIIATAPGKDCDFVSRCFYPRLKVPEDPVTGSAHCLLTPFWANRLGKTKLRARQISARGGSLICALEDDRVFITGQAALYLKGTITLS